jgi:hypothetical protein
VGILEALIFTQTRAAGDAVSSWWLDDQTSRVGYKTILGKNIPDRQETSQKQGKKKSFFRQSRRLNHPLSGRFYTFIFPYIIIGEKAYSAPQNFFNIFP